ARAHRGDPDPATAAAQLVGEGGDHPGAAGGDGVAQAATAPEDVDLVLVDVEEAAGSQRHRGEGLVDLPEVDVAHGQARSFQYLRNDLDCAHAGTRRLDPDRGPGPHSRERCQSV